MFGKLRTKRLFQCIVFWCVLLLILTLISYFIDNSQFFWPGLYIQESGQRNEAMEQFLEFARIYSIISRFVLPIASIFLLWHGLDCLHRILMFCQVSRDKEKEEETEKETD